MFEDIIRLFIKRLMQCIAVVFLVGLLSFSMFRYLGDPIFALTSISETTLEQREALREELGLNKPFYVQYVSYLGRIVVGDFGNSYQYKTPVTTLLGSRVSATLELALTSFTFALIVGILIGVFTSVYTNHYMSHFFVFSASLGISVPSFLIGLFLIYIFSVKIPILPSFGRGDTVRIGGWETNFLSLGGLKALILPALTLGIYQAALVQRVVHAEMTRILKTEYIRYAHIRGLAKRVVFFKHALINVIPTLVSIITIQLGGLIAFSSITETVFQWQGLGLLFIKSLQFADIPVISSYLLFIAILFVILNFISDVTLIIIDPRVREKGK